MKTKILRVLGKSLYLAAAQKKGEAKQMPCPAETDVSSSAGGDAPTRDTAIQFFFARNRQRSNARKARGDLTVMIFIETSEKRMLFDREVQEADTDDDDRFNDNKPPCGQKKRCKQTDPEGKNSQPDKLCGTA